MVVGASPVEIGAAEEAPYNTFRRRAEGWRLK